MAASGGAGSEDEDDILTGGMGFGLDISKYETVECPVPPDQRPIFEYRALKSDFSLKVPRELPVFATQLVIPAVAGLLVAGPVAGYTFPVDKHPAEFALSTMAGTLVPVAMVVLRSYLSWSYVGNRLFSATVEYEESGWWDGQTWVKPPEVLARDRLLGLYQVKPVLEMLKGTLLGLEAAMWKQTSPYV
eukprot:jgi/Mesvir1/17308/Mv07705-RA.1